MEKYRLLLKKTRIINSITLGISIAFLVLFPLIRLNIIPLGPQNLSEKGMDWYYRIVGAFITSFLSISLLNIINCNTALFNPEEFKKMYTRYHDERSRTVDLHAYSAACRIMAFMCCLGGVIAGYFDIMICVTLFSCSFVLVLLMLICKWYYSRKF